MISFDLIIANFPFSNWVKHFLKAWSLLWKWEIVCLLNAETLKNPFSEERKLMKTIIKDNNWEVEYIENAFLDAERKTSVEVALITISKKQTEFDIAKFDQQFEQLTGTTKVATLKSGEELSGSA